MTQELFKQNMPRREKFTANIEGRDFVIGDLHGQIHLLEQFMDFIQFDTTKDRIFSVGDLIDRGDDSFNSLMLIDRPWFHAVKANHEQLMEDFLTQGPTAPWWKPNGGTWWDFLDNMGRADIAGMLWRVQDLPWMITVDLSDGRKFHIIHAEFNTHHKLTDALLDDEKIFQEIAADFSNDGPSLLWGRSLFSDLYAKDITKHHAKLHLSILKKHGLMDHFTDELSPIFSGHTPMRKPTTIGKQTNIDTMAFGVKRHSWAGLTICEPLTNKFWTVKNDGIFEVEPLVIG